MTIFVQAQTDFDLRLEPRMASALVDPLVSVTIADQLEIVGDEVLETLGAAKIRWIKVKSSRGEGFANRDLLKDFVAPEPPQDELLPIELRRTLELPKLATLCYFNAQRGGTNAAILLALAFAETGSAWTTTLAQPKVGSRMGIYGFTQTEWDTALVGVGAEVDIKSSEISRVRAQCEIAGILLSRFWRAIAEAHAGTVRAIDLYIAFLAGAEVANKLANADDAAALSTVLTLDEIAALSTRVSSFETPLAVSGITGRADVVKAIATKFEAALDFVRHFADGLVADNVPSSEEAVEKTEDELAHEDPEDGDDDAVGPGSDLVVTDIAPPPVQPTDGTLLISEAHLIALWKRSMYPIDGRGIIIFGLRGCLPVDSATSTSLAATHRIKMTAVDYRHMRCTIGQWRPGKGFALFPGSTVPFFDLIDTAAGKGGATVNQMGRGRYRNYSPGWHKRKEHKKGHWALLQDSDVVFQRTAGDVNYTPSDPWDAGRPGDNIHCAFHVGTLTDPANSVFSSAGCQVVAGFVEKGRRKSESGPWKTFIAPFLKPSAQSGMEYVLFDAAELREIVQTKLVGKTMVMRIGSEGDLVSVLQQKLGLGNPDKKFGKNTFRAVIKFQHDNFGKSSDDGIVGPQTAQKLGFDLPTFDFDKSLAHIGVVSSEEEVGPPHGALGLLDGTTLGGHTDPKFAALLALISKKESHGNYNAFFANIDNKDHPRLTAMTVKQVRKFQEDLVDAGKKSSAVGKYQIIRKTMKGIVERLGLDGREIFDASLQDRMAIDLLGIRKLGKFLQRKISATEFGNQLAMEWAALPVLSNIRGAHRNVRRGQSFHAGDGLNQAHIEPEEVEAVLAQLIR